MSALQARRPIIKDILHSVGICLLFLLFSRSFSLYFLQEIPVVQATYARLSQLCAAVVIGVFVLNYKKVPKSLYAWLIALYVLLGISTVLGEGSLRRFVSVTYPILALTAFTILECSSTTGIKRFLQSLSWLFTVLVGTNTVLMLAFPTLFGQTAGTSGNIFLIGLENQITYPMTIGLLIVLLNYHFNHDRGLLLVYTVAFVLATIKNFSIGSVIGSAVLLAYLLPPIRNFFRRKPLWVLLVIFAGLFVTLVYFNKPVLNFPPIKYIIEEILQKDTTLTHRTRIWELVGDLIGRQPIFGYGFQHSSSLFTIKAWDATKTLSAHNQYLQTWFEGGTLAMAALIGFLLTGSRQLKRAQDKTLAGYVKLIAIALMVMFLVESPSFGTLFFTMVLGCTITSTQEKEQQRMEAINTPLTKTSPDLISVVVPVYNVEQYLEECITSILQQSYANLEIILVNDGSTDNSYSICQAFAAQDDRIVLLSQENGGLSAARNTGIKAATGRYITFVDSDDALDPDMVQYLYDMLKQHGADMSVCQKELTDEQSKVIPSDAYVYDRLLDGTAAGMRALFDNVGLDTAAHGKLYKMELFAEVEYPVGKYHEDVYTTYRLIHLCDRIIIGARRAYQYRQRAGSIVHAAFSPKHLHAVEANLQRAEFMEQYYPELARLAKAWIVYSCNSCVLKLMKSTDYDITTVAYLQKQYRLYEGAFLLGPSKLSAKLFSLFPFISLRLCLKLAKLLRRK